MVEAIMSLSLTVVLISALLPLLFFSSQELEKIQSLSAVQHDLWNVSIAFEHDLRAADQLTYYNNGQIYFTMPNLVVDEYRISPYSSLLIEAKNGAGTLVVASTLKGISYSLMQGGGVRATLFYGSRPPYHSAIWEGSFGIGTTK
ncbi:hypothetical protein [Ferroacidibacillus organovorans]|uniref:hypothetical protein n=1 Tax=Ferroacidibacillus organovorans TaxID=1765683 RepID=UPI00117857B5|nr:hypothetical protein [Ferroacidibacillus organovorans]